MSCMATLLSSNLPSEIISVQQKCYIEYSLPFSLSSQEPAKTLTLLENRALISASGTTGLRTWDAALRLGTFLVSQEGQGFVEGKNVLELGAGTGFLSILSVLYLGANRILATDGDGQVIEDLKVNMMLNKLEEIQPLTPKSSNGVTRWKRFTQTTQDRIIIGRL